MTANLIEDNETEPVREADFPINRHPLLLCEGRPSCGAIDEHMPHTFVERRKRLLAGDDTDGSGAVDFLFRCDACRTVRVYGCISH